MATTDSAHTYNPATDRDFTVKCEFANTIKKESSGTNIESTAGFFAENPIKMKFDHGCLHYTTAHDTNGGFANGWKYGSGVDKANLMYWNEYEIEFGKIDVTWKKGIGSYEECFGSTVDAKYKVPYKVTIKNGPLKTVAGATEPHDDFKAETADASKNSKMIIRGDVADLGSAALEFKAEADMEFR